MNTTHIHHLQTPYGRNFQVAICPDGTRGVAAHFHKRELLSIAVALDLAKGRAQDLGNSAEQREFEELRDPVELRAVFDEERLHHPEWSVSAFGMMLSPNLIALLELYFKHPESKRSARRPFPYTAAKANLRPPDIRPRPVTPFKHGLDQKQLASGEKPDDD